MQKCFEILSFLNEYDVIADNDENGIHNLIISHFNIRSLINKFEVLKEHILSNNYDIFTLSETWLSEEIKDYVIKIPGYTIFRQDRERRGGGVAIYIRNCSHIRQVKLIAKCTINDIDNVWISAQVNGKSVSIGCIYNPTCANYKALEKLENILADCAISSDLIFCLGDLNINYLDEHSQEYNFLNSVFSSSFNLKQMINKPTRITPHSSTLLDHIWINQPNMVINSEVVNLPEFNSDHCLVYSVVNLPIIRKQTPKFIYTRNIKNINMSEFDNHAGRADWNRVFTIENIDDKVEYMENIITRLFNIHAPLRKIRLTKKFNPWVTSNIKLMMRMRDKALSDYRKSLKSLDISRAQTEAKWIYYKELRNFVTASLRREKMHT